MRCVPAAKRPLSQLAIANLEYSCKKEKRSRFLLLLVLLWPFRHKAWPATKGSRQAETCSIGCVVYVHLHRVAFVIVAIFKSVPASFYHTNHRNATGSISARFSVTCCSFFLSSSSSSSSWMGINELIRFVQGR